LVTAYRAISKNAAKTKAAATPAKTGSPTLGFGGHPNSISCGVVSRARDVIKAGATRDQLAT
jgi:hypothetical protein